ncbi:uncharacterized protein LOC100822285 isoform X2 [Brachypodium distachyon]|uniref:uncharacterized protein LOC100822285 isoform X2 n=1 Tax=Brachypodium distachyon TaxID=15368 RepID=UPI00071DCBDD|nr:uncharacterized protein LOC100822285 isoform X2 [Brachypodium distachyon]|eukprot:XP_014757287.1 uncharacterized protein LOC100822285 isoform X2 [Brachypodium distachyon]
MAELATGAVSTLLGVISNEARRLGRVRGDVQFIQEEMESMSSFLANLSRGNIRDQQHDGGGGDDDDQVRTWMNQVRILANDCNTCLDLYLYRGDPELHRSKAGLRRYLYLWWAPWLMRKMLAQHRAAGQLRELKERAREIGERRLRYGVEVKRSSSSGSGLTKEEVHGEEDDDDDDGGHRPLNQDGGYRRSLKVALSMISMDKEDYLKWRLDDHWIRPVVLKGGTDSKQQVLLPSIVFLVPKTEDVGSLAHQAMNVAERALAHEEGEAAVTLAPDACGAPAREKAHLEHHGKEDKPASEHKIKIKYRQNVVSVDVPEVHYDFLQRRPEDFLYYILHELQEDQQQATIPPTPDARWYGIYWSKREMFREIRLEIQKTYKVKKKIESLKTEICQVVQRKEVQKLDKKDVSYEELREKITSKPLHKLFRLLIESTEQDRTDKAMRKLVASYDYVINQTAMKLKEEIEGGTNLQAPEYEDILWKMFPKPTTAATATANTFVDDQIKEIIHGVKEMLHELRELDSSDKIRETGETSAAQKLQAGFKETTTRKKMEEIERKITKQLKIKGIVRRIQDCLEGDKRILVILRTDGKCVSKWQETRNTLRLLGCAPIAGAIIVATKITQRQDVKEEDLCYPQLELIDYSPVGRFLDTVLQITRQHVHEGSRRILRNIFYKCEAHEFCMKIFAHAMYTKPKRRRQELHKLYMSILHEHDTQKSLPGAAIAKKMFKFSYKDLPKQYRSCLLYLAIFPQGKEIKRSTLIGRWVAEGLITTKDWHWSSSVDEAENCFDTLIARCLVCPAGNGIVAAGRFKSCKVDEPVYGFITKIAKKQRILDIRLSHGLARHFSIFSDVRLRNSEKIENFLESIPNSSQFSKIKVLDLEGCDAHFAKNQHYLRAICSKILMLKYLSLRGTDVIRLPGEINNLLELEVLDIRHTKIPASETRNVLLLKLKRLLAGHVDPSSPPAGFSSVQIPEKIEKMEGVEVLSNVKPKNKRDLNDITKLCMLKKLGVVINKRSDLRPLLLEAISDLLGRCLRSLSITLNIETSTPAGQGILPCSSELPEDKFPKVLESLSIIGSTTQEYCDLLLLTLFAQDAKQLAKNLTSFVIEGAGITEIKFEDGAASNLEKMVCSFTKMESLSGIGNLSRIKEIKFSGETVPKEVEEAMRRQTARRPVYIHNNEEENETNQPETPDDDASSSWKKVKCLGWRN